MKMVTQDEEKERLTAGIVFSGQLPVFSRGGEMW